MSYKNPEVKSHYIATSLTECWFCGLPRKGTIFVMKVTGFKACAPCAGIQFTAQVAARRKIEK